MDESDSGNDERDSVVDGLAVLTAAVGQLRASESRLRTLVEHSPTGLLLLDAAGRVAEANPAAARLLGVAPESLASARLLDLAVSGDGPLLAGRSDRAFATPDGRTVTLLTSVTELPDEGAGAALLVCLDEAPDRRSTERLLMHAALHDSLTNLPNRRLLRDRLETALARARRSGQAVAVLFIDLDDFKRVNDTLGHDAGDELLVAVARNILSALRSCDTVARIGGDEFVVVCEDVTADDEVSQLAGRLQAAIARPVVLRGQPTQVAASIGVAMASARGEGSDELIRIADLAMYRAKAAPEVDYVLADDTMPSAAPGDDLLVSDLRRAIQTDALVLHYQPVVRLSGRVVGLEALVRWPHPRLGMLLPGDFLPVVAGTDLAKPLSDWVLRTAIRDAGAWRDPSLRVSVNVWASELARAGFAETVAALLTWAGMEARGLYLELHGRDLVSAGPALHDALAELQALGVGLAVDDVGHGGSTLADVRALPVDTVKIDRGFVASAQDPADAPMVAAVAAAARAAGRHPLAAGVETAEQLDRLRSFGYESVQGYLTGRPAPLVDLREVIDTRRVELPQHRPSGPQP